MKKLFILSLILLVFGKVNAVVLVALDENNLTGRENAVIGLLENYDLSADILGSNPSWDELTTYSLIIATENGALDAIIINDLINNGKKVLLLYNAGSPLGGTWATDNVINHRYLIIENDIEVFNGYQSNIRIYMQSGNPSCHITGNMPAGWTVAGSNFIVSRKTVLFRKHTVTNGKGLVFTYNPQFYTGPAKNFFALAIEWLTGDSPIEGIVVPEDNVAFIITNNEYNDSGDLTASENNHYNRLLDQGYMVTFIPFGKLSESDLEQADLVTAVEYPSIDRNTIDHLFSEGKNLLLLKTSAAPIGGTWDINNAINNQRLVIEQNAALFDGFSSNLNFRAETAANSASITAMYPAGWIIIGRTFFSSNKTVLYKEDISSGAKALVMTYDPANYSQAMKNFADRAIEWIEGTPPHEGIIVPEGNAAFIITGYEDSYPPELTASENTHYNTLLSQGYDVTFIRSGRLSNSDLSGARLITAVEYPSIDLHSINNKITSGNNLLLMKTSAAPIGGSWDVNNAVNNQRLVIDESEALFKGFVSNLNLRAELQAFSASITSDYPDGWNIIGRTFFQNNKTVLYKEDDQSEGKALVITYDPANFSESMKNFGDLAYYYLEGDAPFEGISIPEGNVAFIISRYNDQGVPDLTPVENNYYNFLVSQGYQVSFLRFSRIFNSDFSEAEFITGIEFPSLNINFIEEKIDEGINILGAFNSGSVIGGQWSSFNSPSARDLIVEDNTCFLSEYEVDETIAVQQSGDAYYLETGYPETWKVLGRNARNINQKTVLSKTSNLSRAIVFSYNTGLLTEDGTDLLANIISYFDEPIEDVYFSVTFSVEDNHGNSITDAIVTLDDQTNEPGVYVFEDIAPGTYSYSVSRQCLATYTGEVTVANENVSENITMTDLPGDANGDGNVDVLDLVSIVSHFLMEEPEPFCFYNADVNQDQVINVLDYIGTVNIFLNGGKFFAFEKSGETATLILSKDGIWLRSNGNVAGIQFELTGDNISQLQVVPVPGTHQFVSNLHNGKFIGAFISLNNTTIPAGDIQLVSFVDNDQPPSWGNAVAGDSNGMEIIIEKTTEEVTHASSFEGTNGYTVYPNPAGQFLTIKSNNNAVTEFRITLFDMKGRVWISEIHPEPTQNSIRLNIMGIPDGAYILEIDNKDSLHRQTIIIQN